MTLLKQKDSMLRKNRVQNNHLKQQTNEDFKKDSSGDRIFPKTDDNPLRRIKHQRRTGLSL